MTTIRLKHPTRCVHCRAALNRGCLAQYNGRSMIACPDCPSPPRGARQVDVYGTGVPRLPLPDYFSTPDHSPDDGANAWYVGDDGYWDYFY